MIRHRYEVGDMIVLKDGFTRTVEAVRTCKIVAALPEFQGAPQYRVRFGNENYERRITEADIDAESTSAPPAPDMPDADVKGTSWVASLRIKTKK